MDHSFNISTEEYFYQRPHMNFFNKIYYDTGFFKKYMPFYEYRSFNPLVRQRSAHWYGRAPQGSWVDGIVDYTYNKVNVQSIGHFEMHENRKNKPQKSHSGGDATSNLMLYPKYSQVHLPKGCTNELNIYKECKDKGQGTCIEEKINIVEICPKWALELLREKKKVMLKATVIDNKTYRDAMKVESYNKGRTLTDITDKNITKREYRRDGYWSDDRYNPVLYPSADHNTNIVLGDEIIYNDFFGGNRVDLVGAEREKYMNINAE